MKPRWTHVVASLSLVAAGGFASGCGSASDGALRASLSALQTPAASAPKSSGDPGAPQCGDPAGRAQLLRSLRPLGPVPALNTWPSQSFMATIARNGQLVAGVDQNTKLLGYLNPLDQQIEGFEIDLLHQLSMALFGRPDRVVFRALTTGERRTAVRDGSVDIVVDAYTITCRRAAQVDFSTPYLVARQRVLVPSGSPAKSLADMNGKRVCATTPSTSLALLQSRYPRVHPYVVTQRTDCLVALQRNRVDGITSDDVILLGFKEQDPYTKLIGPPLEPEPYGMAISPRHPEFVRFVNAVLARLRADGTMQRLYRTWHLGARKQPAIRYRDATVVSR